MLIRTYTQYKEKKAFIYRVGEQEFDVSYTKLFDDVLVLSRSLKAKKVEKGSKVMFVCDNRYEWMVTDLALISLGAIGIPRGCDTPTLELEFILSHSEADFLIVENEAVYIRHEAILSAFSLKAIFIVESLPVHTLLSNVYAYNDILKDKTIHPEELEAFIASSAVLDEDDLFTIIYTSGTTGTPKGVMLTHKNIMHQTRELPFLIGLQSNDVWVSILPSWHIFERAAEYLSLTHGCCTIYSTIKTFAADLEYYKPTLVATVPRLWESMYTKINTALEKKDAKKAKIFKKLVAVSAAYNRNVRVLKDELPLFEARPFVLNVFDKIVAGIKVALLFPLNLLAKKETLLGARKIWR